MAGKTFKEFDGGVNFGTVSIGETTARLGVKIDRGVCSASQADKLFCNRRLIGSVVLGKREDGNGQKTAFDTDRTVKGVFDVKGFSANAKQIGIGLTFSLKDVDIAELAHFSSGAGRLKIEEVSSIPDEKPEDEEEETDSDE
jgi:hypothetical protein